MWIDKLLISGIFDFKAYIEQNKYFIGTSIVKVIKVKMLNG